MAQDDGIRTLGGACAVVVWALMVTGWLRHAVVSQAILATPALVASALCLGRRRWAKWAAAAIFVTWLAIPFLSLWPPSTLMTGGFSTAEIATTVVLAATSALGLVRIVRQPAGTAWPVAVGTFLLFAAAQAAAMVAGSGR